MPVNRIPEKFVSNVACSHIDDFLMNNGWEKYGVSDDGMQYWRRLEEYGFFTSGEALGYEFVRFIQLGKS